MRRVRPLALLLAMLAAPPGTAAADPLDTLGFGPRDAAMGTAGAAAGEALESAHANPAAAGRGTGPSLALGYLFAAPEAQLNGRDADLAAAHGVLFAAAVPFRLLGVRFGAALALHVPDRFFARIALPGATEPRLLRWSDWLHVTSVSAVLSVEVGGGFSLGAGVALLADATARGTVELGAQSEGATGTADVVLEMPLRVAPVAGLLFEPAPFLALALTFRGGLSMDVDLDLHTDADFADDSLTGQARTHLRGTAYHSPQVLEFGVTARWAGWTLDADLAWYGWSALDLPVADVDTAIALGAPAPIVHRLFPHPAWTDTLVPAVGLEYAFAPAAGHQLEARAGYAYESSPVPPQSGLSNVADPDRHLLAAGIGWRMTLDDEAALDDDSDRDDQDHGGPSLGAGLAFQAHRLVPFTTTKELPEFAGGPLSAAGWVWAFQLWAGVTL